MKRAKEDNVGILLPDNETMKDLGVLEVCKIKMEKMKETVTKEYKRRLKLLLKSKLNGGNMIRSINGWWL